MSEQTAAERIVEIVASFYWHGSSTYVPLDRMDVDSGAVFAAWNAVQALSTVPGVAPWLIVALGATAATEAQRAYLAAGPFEDLLEHAEHENLHPVEVALETNPWLVDCLYRMNDPGSPQGVAWLASQKTRHPRPGGAA